MGSPLNQRPPRRLDQRAREIHAQRVQAGDLDLFFVTKSMRAALTGGLRESGVFDTLSKHGAATRTSSSRNVHFTRRSGPLAGSICDYDLPAFVLDGAEP